MRLSEDTRCPWLPPDRSTVRGTTGAAEPDPIDPSSGLTAEVRNAQPYRANKRYLCPGCNQDIEVGAGHVVVVPKEAPDLRRHWHRACWEHRSTRQAGRSAGVWGKGRGGGRRGPPTSR